MLNQLLGGHYLVVQDLGEGGLAKTYIAEDYHRPGHPKCAVKYLKPASDNPGFLTTARRLFNKEAEILEKLGQHDQIPRLLAYFEENQEFYLVQELIEGHTLSAELPSGHRWSENKVIQMLQDVLQILQSVHSYGVIHRDIKPNNLIRRQKDGRLVLIDFGAVKQIRDPSIMANAPLTQKTISIGTQGYIPTEQVRGKPRLNSDIYAVGMIGIQALTGIHPFNLQEDADGEIIWQNRAEVSNELAAILTKMIRYHFKERYQSVTEVLGALETLAHYDTPIQSNSDTRQTSPKATIEPNWEKTNVSLDIDPWNLEAVSEVELRKTKFAPNVKQPTPKASVEPELLETKASLDVENLNAEAVSEPKLQEKKVVPKRGKPTSELATEKKEKSSTVSPADSLASSQDLESNQTNIFVHLNQYRLLIGVGLASVLVSIVAGYTYITHRQFYLQTQEILEQINRRRVDGDYQGCIQQAEIFPRDHSDLHAKAETLLNECRQLQSDSQAREDLETIKVLKAKEDYQECRQKAEIFLREHSDLHTKAETLLNECSQQLAEATKLVEGSDRGIDYTQLSNYLKASNWREADLETHRVMLEATNKSNLTQESIENFPCKDLGIINSLWQEYSEARFGFSIQNKEYQNVNKSFNSLGDRLGWRQGNWMTYNRLWEKFNLNVVPDGHLPARVFRREEGEGMWYRTYIREILDRTNSCNL